MKKLIIISCAIMLTYVTGYGQTCKYDIVYNPITGFMEAHMYVLTDYSDPLDANLGPSAFSVIFPASFPNNPVESYSIIPVNPAGAVWTDGTPVYEPEVEPSSDFHKFTTLGAKFNPGTKLTAGTDILLFSFRLLSTKDAAKIRMYVNWDWDIAPQTNPDPRSSAPGMEGGDFRSSYQSLVSGESYVGLVNSSPTIGNIKDIIIINEPLSFEIPLKGITPGRETTQQVISVAAVTNNKGLFTNLDVFYIPGESTGTLTVGLVPNQSGEARLTLRVQDNGGTTNGGLDTTEKTFLIKVYSIGEKVNISIFEESGSLLVTDVLNLSESFGIKLWPNPTNGPVNIDMMVNRIHELELKVFNILGEEVFYKKYRALNHISFDMSRFVSGIYNVQLDFGESKSMYKLILDRK